MCVIHQLKRNDRSIFSIHVEEEEEEKGRLGDQIEMSDGDNMESESGEIVLLLFDITKYLDLLWFYWNFVGIVKRRGLF